MVNTPNELIYELLRYVENKEESLIVDDACQYLGHPEDPDDRVFRRCFCREKVYSKTIFIHRQAEAPKNSFLVIPIDENGNKDEQLSYYILK